MKKEYVKPEVLVEEMLLGGMLAMSSTDITDKPVIPFSNKRDEERDTWGNLWD